MCYMHEISIPSRKRNLLLHRVLARGWSERDTQRTNKQTKHPEHNIGFIRTKLKIKAIHCITYVHTFVSPSTENVSKRNCKDF